MSGAKHHRAALVRKRGHVRHVASRKPVRSHDVTPQTEVAAPLSGDLAAVKDALDLVRKAKVTEASAIEKRIGDPAAQKLVEWLILRHTAEASFTRYAGFIADNPRWPSSGRVNRQKAQTTTPIASASTTNDH